MVKLTERPESELDALAIRVADALNGLASKLPIQPDDVDMRIIAELCWALGVTPSISITPAGRAALQEAE